MGLSLKDQLLKAGVVNKKQAKKAAHEKRSSKKKNKGKPTAPKVNKSLMEQQAREKRNHELNQKRNKEKLKHEHLAQVKQLIKTNRLKLEDGDDPYYFKVGKTIKKLYVNKEISSKLTSGLLAIVKNDDHFAIVPSKVAKQIADRDPDTFVVLHEPEK